MVKSVMFEAVDSSILSGQKELVTQVLLTKNQALELGSDEKGRNLVSYMNDADFEMPNRFTYLLILKCFVDYLAAAETSKCNCIALMDENGKVKEISTRVEILPGQALTRRYRLNNWITFLLTEVKFKRSMWHDNVASQIMQIENSDQVVQWIVDAYNVVRGEFCREFPQEFESCYDTLVLIKALNDTLL